MGAESDPRDPNWSHKSAKRSAKGGQRAPKGAQSEPKINQNAPKGRYPKKVEKAWPPGIYFSGPFWTLFWSKNASKNRCENWSPKNVKKNKKITKHNPGFRSRKHDFSNLFCKSGFSRIVFLVGKHKGFQRSKGSEINIFSETVRAKSKQKTSPKKDASRTENMSKIGPKIDQKTVQKASKNRFPKKSKKRQKTERKSNPNLKKNGRVARALSGFYPVKKQNKLQTDKVQGKVHPKWKQGEVQR